MTHSRTFTLIRDTDVTGISGTGPVADGIVFPDGVTILRWRDVTGPNAERGVRPTTVVHESPEAVEALHGHNGATRIMWGVLNAVCKHCGAGIFASDGQYWLHIFEGGYLTRCRPEKSLLEYGYSAEPEDTPCTEICLGHREQDGASE